MFGFDYGIRPNLMILGDVEYPKTMGQQFLAVGYVKCPSFESQVDIPGLGLIFETEKAALDCFGHLKAWVKSSSSGDAAAITFVEFEDRTYGMCVYQDIHKLIDRSIPKFLQNEVTPFCVTVSYMKRFPIQSSGYSWFKVAVQNKPFVVVPGTKEGGPLWNQAFLKSATTFYRERDVPEHSPEASAIRASRAQTAFTHREIPKEMLPKPTDVHRRRRQQLRRFFPVTLQRMRWSAHYKDASESLKREGYRDWQILQAVCNRSLPLRLPDLFADANRDSTPIDVLARLVDTYEALDSLRTPVQLTDLENIRFQIRADAQQLLEFFQAPDESGTADTQAELLKRGFLD